MNNSGLSTTFEKGDIGQFEVFESRQGNWISYIKAGVVDEDIKQGNFKHCFDEENFITLSQVERKLISGWSGPDSDG